MHWKVKVGIVQAEFEELATAIDWAKYVIGSSLVEIVISPVFVAEVPKPEVRIDFS